MIPDGGMIRLYQRSNNIFTLTSYMDDNVTSEQEIYFPIDLKVVDFIMTCNAMFSVSRQPIFVQEIFIPAV